MYSSNKLHNQFRTKLIDFMVQGAVKGQHFDFEFEDMKFDFFFTTWKFNPTVGSHCYFR